MVRLPAPNPYADRREYIYPIRIDKRHTSKEDGNEQDLIEIRFESTKVRFRDKRKESQEYSNSSC